LHRDDFAFRFVSLSSVRRPAVSSPIDRLVHTKLDGLHNDLMPPAPIIHKNSEESYKSKLKHYCLLKDRNTASNQNEFEKKKSNQIIIFNFA
jgi:hypothetical protein